MTSHLNTTVNDSVQMQNICAGKECQRQGTHHLKVKYLNKSGWFCSSCKERLQADDLVYEPINWPKASSIYVSSQAKTDLEVSKESE
jgi:hypothetical protein